MNDTVSLFALATRACWDCQHWDSSDDPFTGRCMHPVGAGQRPSAPLGCTRFVRAVADDEVPSPAVGDWGSMLAGARQDRNTA